MRVRTRRESWLLLFCILVVTGSIHYRYLRLADRRDTLTVLQPSRTQVGSLSDSRESKAVSLVSTEISGLRFLNDATSDELCMIPGIGPVLAQRILQFRKDYGPLQQFEDLLFVEGIGEKRLAGILRHLLASQTTDHRKNPSTGR